MAILTSHKFGDGEEVPTSWQIVALGEIARTTSGGTPSRKVSAYYEGNILWVKSGELGDSRISSTEEHISELGLRNSNAKVFPRNTLLLALYGATAGKVGWLDVDAATNQAVCAIFPDSRADSEYLFYALIHSRNELLGKRYGGAQPNLSQRTLREFLLPLPSLAEQRRIAAVLNAIQDAIAAQEDVIAAARALKRSLMQRLFTYGPYREPAETKETEIGEIPVHWEVTKLGEIGEVQAGGTPSRKNEEFWNAGVIPWVKTLDLNESIVSVTDEEISLAGFNSIRGAIRPEGTVMVAMYGGAGTIGKSGILGIPAATNQAVCCIEPNPDRYVSQYLLQYMISIRPQWMKYALGTRKDPNISKSIVVNKDIPLPPMEEQSSIAHNLLSIDAKIAAEEDRLTALQALFKSMLHQLMTGQIRVLSDEGLPIPIGANHGR